MPKFKIKYEYAASGERESRPELVIEAKNKDLALYEYCTSNTILLVDDLSFDDFMKKEQWVREWGMDIDIIQ